MANEKKNPPIRDGFDALQQQNENAPQTGKYHIARRCRVEVFDLRNVKDAEQAINDFYAELTEPGWDFTIVHGGPLSITIVAVQRDLVQTT